MAHIQQAEFCREVKQRFPEFFFNRMVLDVGSLDINGNNQFLFEYCQYIGIDLAPGRNVDFVTKGHELALPDESFDVVVSTECFEHDQYYGRTLQNIVRMLKPGGLFFFSCATSGRPEHGTRRSTPHDAPFIQQMGDWSDYYKNLDEADIRSAIDVESIFSAFEFSTNHESKDLYFWGIKKGKLISRSDYSFQISESSSRAKANEIICLRSLLHERDAAIQLLQESLTVKDDLLNEQERRLTASENQVKALMTQVENIRGSFSWRLTVPVRVLGRLIRGEYSLIWRAFLARIRRSSDNNR